jgi:hypothetical protein
VGIDSDVTDTSHHCRGTICEPRKIVPEAPCSCFVPEYYSEETRRCFQKTLLSLTPHPMGSRLKCDSPACILTDACSFRLLLATWWSGAKSLGARKGRGSDWRKSSRPALCARSSITIIYHPASLPNIVQCRLHRCISSKALTPLARHLAGENNIALKRVLSACHNVTLPSSYQSWRALRVRSLVAATGFPHQRLPLSLMLVHQGLLIRRY